MDELERTDHAHGLGLRAQILLALGAAFLLSFTALGVIVVQLAHKAQEVEGHRRNLAIAEALAVSVQAQRDGASPGEALARLVGRAEIAGVALAAPRTAEVAAGARRGPPTVHTQLGDGSQLSLWITPPEAETTGPLGR